MIIDVIATSAGKLINPFTVTAENGEFDLRVIAHALSMQCRYAGHTKRFYSVAEHSLLVERAVLRDLKWHGYSAHDDNVSRVCQWALVHDAEEAYLPDMVVPIKQKHEMQWYRDAGKRLMGELAKWFGLDGEEPELVKRKDAELRGTERHWLFPPCDEWITAPPDLSMVCGTMSPEGAREAWLARFHELWPDWQRGMTA